MKNYVLKMVTAVIAMMPLAAPAVNSIIHTATYDFSNMTVGLDSLGGTPYKTLHYQGLYNGGEPGAPSLPIDYIRFSVPHNATNFTVTAVLRDNTFANLGNYMVYPCQQPRLMSDTSAWTITLPDSNIYNSNAYYPASNAWVASEGFLAGENHIVTVAVAPVSYRHNVVGNTASNQLRQSRTVRLTLSYELSDTLAMYPIVRQNDALRQEGYALTRSMVANPQNVESFAPVDIAIDSLTFINPNSGDGINSHIAPPDSSNVNPDPGSNYGGDLQLMQYPYLVVTTPELKHSLRRIAALKRQKGYNVKIVTMDEVTNDPYASQGDLVKNSEGNYEVAYDDDAGKLRQFLKHYFQRYGTKYVLLAGTDVPYRYIARRLWKDSGITNIPSDLYYCDLSGNWYIDSVDICPELFVGRLLATDSIQITNYIDKLLRYELNPGKGDPSYLGRAFMSCSIDLKESGEFWRVRPSLEQLYPESDFIQEIMFNATRSPSGEEIIDSINSKQYGFISLNHHGCPAGLITYGAHDNSHYDDYRFLWAIDTIHVYGDTARINDDPSTTNGLNNMNNKWFPMVCYSSACSSMPFDKKIHYESIPMNFGESFTTGRDYGGPAYIGNTRDGYTPNTGYLETAFLSMLKMGCTNIGVANGLAKTIMPNEFDSIAAKATPIIQNLLGDPEFDIWTDIPESFADINIAYADTYINITQNTWIDSTFVSYMGIDGSIKTCIASADLTLRDISPNGSILIHKANHLPYLAPLLLQNVLICNSQYIFASSANIGKSVDSNRTKGNVTIAAGANFEIEASGDVRLEDGFNVEKGATFAIYPSCF